MLGQLVKEVSAAEGAMNSVSVGSRWAGEAPDTSCLDGGGGVVSWPYTYPGGGAVVVDSVRGALRRSRVSGAASP